mgnify:CR=1 FL=1
MNKISDLQIGKAGEYLVCADLILKGYIAYPSEQGLPYDVVLDNGKQLIKIQVKTTREYKKILNSPEQSPFYVFNIGMNGKKHKRKEYCKNDVDVFAIVAVDTYEIGYLKNEDVKTTMNFRVSKFKGTYINEKRAELKMLVNKLRSEGVSVSEISSKLNINEHTVYKYNKEIYKTTLHGKEGRYLSDCKIEDLWTK